LAPVAVAGGSNTGSTKDLTEFVESALDSGAKGIIFGRNVFQREDIADTLVKIKSVWS